MESIETIESVIVVVESVSRTGELLLQAASEKFNPANSTSAIIFLFMVSPFTDVFFKTRKNSKDRFIWNWQRE